MSIIHFHVEADNISDLKRQLREALVENEPTISVKLPVDPCRGEPDEEGVSKTSGSPVPGVETTVDSSSKNEELTQASSAEQEQPETKTYTLVEVRAAANTYRDKHGIEPLREIFKKYGGEKLKDIPESNYAALMKEIA